MGRVVTYFIACLLFFICSTIELLQAQQGNYDGYKVLPCDEYIGLSTNASNYIEGDENCTDVQTYIEGWWYVIPSPAKNSLFRFEFFPDFYNHIKFFTNPCYSHEPIFTIKEEEKFAFPKDIDTFYVFIGNVYSEDEYTNLYRLNDFKLKCLGNPLHDLCEYALPLATRDVLSARLYYADNDINLSNSCEYQTYSSPDVFYTFEDYGVDRFFYMNGHETEVVEFEIYETDEWNCEEMHCAGYYILSIGDTVSIDGTFGDKYYLRLLRGSWDTELVTYRDTVGLRCGEAIYDLPELIDTLSPEGYFYTGSQCGDTSSGLWYEVVGESDILEIKSYQNAYLRIYHGLCDDMVCIEPSLFFKDGYKYYRFESGIGEIFKIQVLISGEYYGIEIEHYTRPANDFCHGAQPALCGDLILVSNEKYLDSRESCLHHFINSWYSFEGTGESLVLRNISENWSKYNLKAYNQSCDDLGDCINIEIYGGLAIIPTHIDESILLSVGISDQDTSGFEVICQQLPTQVNDHCLGALSVGCSDLVDINLINTHSNQACLFESPRNGLWFEIVGQGNIVEIALRDPLHSDINVFYGGCDSLICIDDVLSTTQGIRRYMLQQGEHYLISFIADKTISSSGFEVSDCFDQIVNDDCLSATQLTCVSDIIGDLSFALKGKDYCADVYREVADVWYKIDSSIKTLEIRDILQKAVEIRTYTGTCDSLVCVQDNSGGLYIGGDTPVYLQVLLDPLEDNFNSNYHFELNCDADLTGMIPELAYEISCSDTLSIHREHGWTADIKKSCSEEVSSGIWLSMQGTGEMMIFKAIQTQETGTAKAFLYEVKENGSLNCIDYSHTVSGAPRYLNTFQYFGEKGMTYKVFLSVAFHQGASDLPINVEMSLNCYEYYENIHCATPKVLNCDETVSDYYYYDVSIEEDCPKGFWYQLPKSDGPIYLDKSQETKWSTYTEIDSCSQEFCDSDNNYYSVSVGPFYSEDLVRINHRDVDFTVRCETYASNRFCMDARYLPPSDTFSTVYPNGEPDYEDGGLWYEFRGVSNLVIYDENDHLNIRDLSLHIDSCGGEEIRFQSFSEAFRILDLDSTRTYKLWVDAYKSNEVHFSYRTSMPYENYRASEALLIESQDATCDTTILLRDFDYPEIDDYGIGINGSAWFKVVIPSSGSIMLESKTNTYYRYYEIKGDGVLQDEQNTYGAYIGGFVEGDTVLLNIIFRENNGPLEFCPFIESSVGQHFTKVDTVGSLCDTIMNEISLFPEILKGDLKDHKEEWIAILIPPSSYSHVIEVEQTIDRNKEYTLALYSYENGVLDTIMNTIDVHSEHAYLKVEADSVEKVYYLRRTVSFANYNYHGFRVCLYSDDVDEASDYLLELGDKQCERETVIRNHTTVRSIINIPNNGNGTSCKLRLNFKEDHSNRDYRVFFVESNDTLPIAYYNEQNVVASEIYFDFPVNCDTAKVQISLSEEEYIYEIEACAIGYTNADNYSCITAQRLDVTDSPIFTDYGLNYAIDIENQENAYWYYFEVPRDTTIVIEFINGNKPWGNNFSVYETCEKNEVSEISNVILPITTMDSDNSYHFKYYVSLEKAGSYYFRINGHVRSLDVTNSLALYYYTPIPNDEIEDALLIDLSIDTCYNFNTVNATKDLNWNCGYDHSTWYKSDKVEHENIKFSFSVDPDTYNEGGRFLIYPDISVVMLFYENGEVALRECFNEYSFDVSINNIHRYDSLKIGVGDRFSEFAFSLCASSIDNYEFDNCDTPYEVRDINPIDTLFFDMTNASVGPPYGSICNRENEYVDMWIKIPHYKACIELKPIDFSEAAVEVYPYNEDCEFQTVSYCRYFNRSEKRKFKEYANSDTMLLRVMRKDNVGGKFYLIISEDCDPTSKEGDSIDFYKNQKQSNLSTTDFEHSIFPNPASNSLFIQFGKESSFMDVSIYDIQGTLHFQDLLPNNSQIDLTNWHAGQYLVVLTNPNSGKSVIEKILIVD